MRDPSKLRVWIVAGQGKGKSHFLASIPRCFVVDAEDAFYAIGEKTQPDSSRYATLGRIPGKDGMTVMKRSLHWKKISRFLASPEAKERFDTIAMDTGDRFLTDIIDLLTEDHNNWAKKNNKREVASITEWGEAGAGWSKVHKRFCGELRKIFASGYGWVLASHQDENGKSGLAPGIRKFLGQDTDFVGRIITSPHTVNVKTDKKDPRTGKPIITTKKVVGHYLRFVPDFEKESGDSFEKQRTPLAYDSDEGKNQIRFGKTDGWAKFTKAIKDGQETEGTF